MRELPPQGELLKKHDRDSIIVLPPNGWYCVRHEQPLNDYLGTVDWIEGPNGREYGRCRDCGQKYVLLEVA